MSTVISGAGSATQSVKKARPFLKWVGGKTQLLAELKSHAPKDFGRYHEPFIGGGALYFSLSHQNSTISDINPELINVYTVIRDSVEDLIAYLKEYAYKEDLFYDVRGWDRDESFSLLPPITRAARTIFLNKTCFNGLYRLNKKGQFNSPFGRYSNPNICDEFNLRACSAHLRYTNIFCHDFEDIINHAEAGDFVYFDPPYIPLSPTSSFTSYTKGSFGLEEHIKLRDVCCELHSAGVKFLLSNSDTETTRSLYGDFGVSTVQASRSVNSKGSKRGKVSEVLVQNYLS